MSKTLKMYAVYDSKVQSFDRPFFMRSRGEALRSWQQISNDTQSGVCSHPEDYSLFELGTWDTDQARLTHHVTPLCLGRAVEFQKLTSENRESFFETKLALSTEAQ